MEVIKNYLETMFANMPNTEAVRKAKAELLAMMEDKYNELLADGKSENEAVGTVISEFGNLDELAEDLGLKDELEEEKRTSASSPRRSLSLDEVNGYVAMENKSALWIGIGVMLCVSSVSWPVLFDTLPFNNAFGPAGMFLSIFAAVGIFVYNRLTGRDFEYIEKEACKIDKATADYIAGERKRNISMLALLKALGIVFCAACWVPLVAMSSFNRITENVGVVVMFWLIGLGVFFIIYSSKREGAYKKVLEINDSNTISGTYGKKESEMNYKNSTMASIMMVYWPTVSCIYLIWSFLTFHWHISWIIWPIAGVMHRALEVAFREE